MNTTNEFVNEFEALCQEMVLKMKPKNSDYARGSDPFKNLRRHGTHGIVVRMDDKICRLDSLTALTSDGIPQVKDESIEDTAMDLATYSLLLIMLNRQLKREGLPLLKTPPDIEQIREALAQASVDELARQAERLQEFKKAVDEAVIPATTKSRTSQKTKSRTSQKTKSRTSQNVITSQQVYKSQ